MMVSNTSLFVLQGGNVCKNTVDVEKGACSVFSYCVVFGAIDVLSRLLELM